MSKVIGTGVVGPMYYEYMAAVMEGGLAEIVQVGRIEPDSIPKGVMWDCQKFFELIAPALAGALPGNPLPATLNVHYIATELLIQLLPPSVTKDDINGHLGEFSIFVSRLNQPRVLDDQEKATANLLNKFFNLLKKAGMIEASDHHYTGARWEDLSTDTQSMLLGARYYRKPKSVFLR